MQSKLRSKLKSVMGERQYDKLRSMRRLIKDPVFVVRHAFTKNMTEPRLADIGRYHGTDKADQNHAFMNQSYLDVYEQYFHALRHQDLSILEIGVKNGASLRTWKEYFKNAQVYGIDIDPRCKHYEESRIRIEIGSQDDVDFLRHCFGSDTKFDIIIDDGIHVNSFIIKSFDYLFNQRLNPGGIYIMEDLSCSYEKLQTNGDVFETWPGMKCNDPAKSYDNDRKDMDNFFLEKIEKLDHRAGNILCIHFWSMVAVIIKAQAEQMDRSSSSS